MTSQTPAATPIPTDKAGFYQYMRGLTLDEQVRVADRLAVQLGGTPDAIERATNMVERELRDIEHDNEISRERAALARAIDDATKAIADAKVTLGRLCDLRDVEYTESDRRLSTMQQGLDEAGTWMRVVYLRNPCRKEQDEAGR